MITSTTVGKIMSSNVFTLKADASVTDAVRLLVEHDEAKTGFIKKIEELSLEKEEGK